MTLYGTNVRLYNPSDPARPVVCFGCCRCQREHADGLDPLFHPHLYFQSRHGPYERPPTLAEMFRRMVEEST